MNLRTCLIKQCAGGLLLLTMGLLVASVVLRPEYQAVAQAPSPTPLSGRISTSTPLPMLGSGNAVLEPTPTPTVTVSNIAFVEALSTANVRADSDPNAAILGVIETGTQYQIIGRYYQWYYFRYDRSPNGRGWVHESVVSVIGDTNAITDLTVEEAEPTIDAASAGATQTWEAITLTPGVVLTATANARLLTGPVVVNVAGSEPIQGDAPPVVGSGTLLPTFTPPPALQPLAAASTPVPELQAEVAMLPPTPQPGLTTLDNTPIAIEIAPIIPIGLLAGLGLAGLMISALRR